MNLLELADRVEAATGPDRELDLLAAEAAGAVRQRNGSVNISAPYTASLDAAMTLVPEGMDWSVGTQPDLGDGKRAWGTVSPAPFVFVAEGEIATEAATPALALTAAVLRARHVQQTQEL